MRDLYGRVPDKMKSDGKHNDTALIIALMLILKSEGCDPMLLFALIYILT